MTKNKTRTTIKTKNKTENRTDGAQSTGKIPMVADPIFIDLFVLSRT